MNLKILLILLLALIPTLDQFFTTSINNYWIGLIIRILLLIFVPIFSVMYFKKISFKEAFLFPLHFTNKKIIKNLTTFGCIAALVIIGGATLILLKLIDFNLISKNLIENFGITKFTYPFVASSIILINPFIEEYFWRGFIFRELYENSKSKLGRQLTYFSGFLFALHHMIIVQGWFTWWQWWLVVIFLGLVGVYFNYIYNKTKNIYSTWIIHAFADLIIVIIGFVLVF